MAKRPSRTASRGHMLPLSLPIFFNAHSIDQMGTQGIFRKSLFFVSSVPFWYWVVIFVLSFLLSGYWTAVKIFPILRWGFPPLLFVSWLVYHIVESSYVRVHCLRLRRGFFFRHFGRAVLEFALWICFLLFGGVGFWLPVGGVWVSLLEAVLFFGVLVVYIFVRVRLLPLVLDVCTAKPLKSISVRLSQSRSDDWIVSRALILLGAVALFLFGIPVLLSFIFWSLYPDLASSFLLSFVLVFALFGVHVFILNLRLAVLSESA